MFHLIVHIMEHPWQLRDQFVQNSHIPISHMWWVEVLRHENRRLISQAQGQVHWMKTSEKLNIWTDLMKQNSTLSDILGSMSSPPRGFASASLEPQKAGSRFNEEENVGEQHEPFNKEVGFTLHPGTLAPRRHRSFTKLVRSQSVHDGQSLFLGAG